MSIRLKDTIYDLVSNASNSSKLNSLAGDVYMQYKTATIPATAGWYRIAQTSSGISNNLGIFHILASTSGYHTNVILSVGTSYGNSAGTTIQQISCSTYSTLNLTKARIVYHTTYSGNYAYLEVYHSVSSTNSISVKFQGHGWSLIAPNTAGSIPSGYSNKEITFVKNAIVASSFKGTADVASKLGTGTVGSSTGPIYLSSGTATACTGRTVPGIKSSSSKSDSGWGTNNTYVPDMSFIAYWNGAYTGTSSNLTYCNQGAFGNACTKAYTTSVTSGSGSLVTSGAVYTALQGYSTTSHNHDSVYAAKSHTHDDRYYTETEIDNKINRVKTVQPTGTAIGWYRLGTICSSNAGNSQNVIISLQRSYNSPENEHYIFAISVGYNGHVSINQISGYKGGQLIDKVRVVYNNSGNCYFDYYMKTSNYNNTYKATVLAGDFKTLQDIALVSEAGGTVIEFATGNGIISNYGFTGDLTGNASSATKLGSNAGSVTNPIYFSGGKPVACTYSLNKTVPSNAVFTDTTYSAGTGISLSGTTFSNSGVRSISTGDNNGTIKVNTGGTSTNVSVKGLGSAAYLDTTGVFTATTHSDYNNNQTQLVSRSFMSYWTGAYNSSGTSNLTYCKHGAFGNACIKSYTTSVTSGSGSLVTSGAVYTALQSYSKTDHTHSSYAGKVSVAFTPATGELTAANVLSHTGGFSIAKGTWSYAGNGYIKAGSFGNIDLAGCSVLTFGSGSVFTQLYITASTQSGHSGLTNEMFFYNDHGSDYSPGWTRVLTDRNYGSYCAAKSHSHSYLPLSGGTMTGNITIFSGADGRGLKFGTSTLNSLNNQMIWQSSEAIRFGSASWDWNAWAGLKYNHSSKIIYLGLADGTIFNANSAQSGGKIYTPGVSSIYVGNGSNIVLHSGNWSTYCAAASHSHDYAATNHTHNYAGSNTSAGKAYDLYGHSGNPGSHNNVGVRWFTMSSTNSGSSGYAGTNAGFPVSNNANGMLWLGNHSGPYGGQLGISSNGRLYYRFISNGSFPTTANGGSWNKIAWTSDIPSSLKCPNSLTIQGNGTSLGSYDGSAAKTINITYSNVGAAAASHTHSYIPLSGGTLSSGTARISRAGSSVSWYQGRSNAMMYISSYSGYNAIASMKTTNGDWSIGVYSSNYMYFTYITDTNYNSGTNTTTCQFIFRPDGYIQGNLSGYATSAGNADTVDSHHFSTVSALPSSPNSNTVYFIV